MQNGWGFLETGGLPYYIEVFLEIPHDVAKEKNVVFTFPLLTNLCYKTIAEIKYEMIGTVIVLIVLI